MASADDIDTATVLVNHAYYSFLERDDRHRALNPKTACLFDEKCFGTLKCLSDNWRGVAAASKEAGLRGAPIEEICCPQGPLAFTWTDPGTGALWYAVRGTVTYHSTVNIGNPLQVLRNLMKEPELLADMQMLVFGMRKPAFVRSAVGAVVDHLRAKMASGGWSPAAGVTIAGHSLGGSIALRAKHVLGKLFPEVETRAIAFAPFVSNVQKYVTPGAHVYYLEGDFVTHNFFTRRLRGQVNFR
jgi:hypothetical protein